MLSLEENQSLKVFTINVSASALGTELSPSWFWILFCINAVLLGTNSFGKLVPWMSLWSKKTPKYL